jgi:hypothetical protein
MNRIVALDAFLVLANIIVVAVKIAWVRKNSAKSKNLLKR